MAAESSRSPAARRLWIWYAAGAAAFIPTIGFHYVGEEAIFPLTSHYMWAHGEWLRQLQYGMNLQHNPLFNWMIIGLCQLVGWEHVLAVARVLTVMATVGSGLVLAWLAQRLTGEREFGAFAALVYLMFADVALYRGWLIYVDPLFGFFIFSSIACLWVACREQRMALLAMAVAALVLGFLAKALTAFVFYGVAVFVMLFDREGRRFLLRPLSLAIHSAGAAAVAGWLGVVPATGGQGARMFKEIVDKFGFVGGFGYVKKVVVYLGETLLKTSPAALLALYYARRRPWAGDAARSVLVTGAAIALLNYLPYWLAPQSHTRYLVPIYPLAALVFARVIWSAGPAAHVVTVRWFAALLAFKLAFVLAIFPYYQKVYRGENYALAAAAIHQRTQGHPLYVTDVSASGMSVAANLDVLRLPAPPLAWPPDQWDSGFVLSYTLHPGLGQLVERYRLGGNEIYLLCRGAACETAAPTPPAGKAQR